ncbi:hypothetical protein [Priestia megaterium]|uniref:hypothetical protein n=1 Tax=Priestia megaterium TaxID=1404 RepID=UPI003CC5F9F8
MKFNVEDKVKVIQEGKIYYGVIKEVEERLNQYKVNFYKLIGEDDIPSSIVFEIRVLEKYLELDLENSSQDIKDEYDKEFQLALIHQYQIMAVNTKDREWFEELKELKKKVLSRGISA